MAESPYLTVKETADYFRVTKQTVTEWCHVPDQNYAIQLCKGGKFLINVKKLEAYLLVETSKNEKEKNKSIVSLLNTSNSLNGITRIGASHKSKREVTRWVQ